MACPFFMPTSKCEDGGWIHPARLPLGGGWNGLCSAPGREGVEPTSSELHESCNLGYATNCPYLPADRSADAVRFSVAQDQGTRLTLCFVCECAHRPVSHGMLEYDISLERWTSSHTDPRIQKMAQCYLQSYLERNFRPVPGLKTSENS